MTKLTRGPFPIVHLAEHVRSEVSILINEEADGGITLVFRKSFTYKEGKFFNLYSIRQTSKGTEICLEPRR